MFNHTLDNRVEIIDWEGNHLIDFAPSIFDFKAQAIENYKLYKISDGYVMRPDLVSLKYYGTTDKTEYILIYNGISNPFTLDKDDILMIPNPNEADSQMKKSMAEGFSYDTGINQTLAVKNAYKYISAKKFPKANANLNFDNSKIGDTSTKRFGKSAYEVDSDIPAVVVKNGKVYFGTNSGMVSANELPSSNIDAKIEKLVNSALGLITGQGSQGNNNGQTGGIAGGNLNGSGNSNESLNGNNNSNANLGIQNNNGVSNNGSSNNSDGNSNNSGNTIGGGSQNNNSNNGQTGGGSTGNNNLGGDSTSVGSGTIIGGDSTGNNNLGGDSIGVGSGTITGGGGSTGIGSGTITGGSSTSGVGSGTINNPNNLNNNEFGGLNNNLGMDGNLNVNGSGNSGNSGVSNSINGNLNSGLSNGNLNLGSDNSGLGNANLELSDSLCESIDCGNSCKSNNCISPEMSITDILNGSKSIL